MITVPPAGLDNGLNFEITGPVPRYRIRPVLVMITWLSPVVVVVDAPVVDDEAPVVEVDTPVPVFPDPLLPVPVFPVPAVPVLPVPVLAVVTVVVVVRAAT